MIIIWHPNPTWNLNKTPKKTTKTIFYVFMCFRHTIFSSFSFLGGNQVNLGPCIAIDGFQGPPMFSNWLDMAIMNCGSHVSQVQTSDRLKSFSLPYLTLLFGFNY